MSEQQQQQQQQQHQGEEEEPDRVEHATDGGLAVAQEAAATDAHHHHDGEEKAAAGGAPDITNLHSVKIDNLSFDLTPDEITDMFMEFGELGDVYVPRNHYTQKSRGFAFARFVDLQSAEAAIEAMNEKEIAGRIIRCTMADEKKPDTRGPFRERANDRGGYRRDDRHGGGGGGGDRPRGACYAFQRGECQRGDQCRFSHEAGAGGGGGGGGGGGYRERRYDGGASHGGGGHDRREPYQRGGYDDRRGGGGGGRPP
jgi:hypothetical protein